MTMKQDFRLLRILVERISALDLKSTVTVGYRATLIMSILVLTAPIAAIAELPRYQVLDLGTLGGQSSSGVAINDAGQVTGWAHTTGGDQHAFVYTDGAMIDLGTLGGSSSRARDINNSGQIIGNAYTTDGRWSPFIYSEGNMVEIEIDARGILDDLGEPTSPFFSSATSINEAGEVVGYVGAEFYPEFYFRAFFYSESGISNLGSAGRYWGQALVVNNTGQVAGIAVTPEGDGDAFVSPVNRPINTSDFFVFGENIEVTDLNDVGQVTGYRDGGTIPFPGGFLGYDTGFIFSNNITIDIGTLGGPGSHAAAVNARGQVTGTAGTRTIADPPYRESHAFIWEDGEMVDLGTLGGQSSSGVAINDAGQVTGWAHTTGGDQHAFVYTDGAMIDLGTLGREASFGVDINQLGQITGYARTGFSNRRAFLATPISLLFSQLYDSVIGVGPGKSLSNKVSEAIAYYASDDLESTCAALGGLRDHIDRFAMMYKPKIAAGQAEQLIEDAFAIEEALGCL